MLQKKAIVTGASGFIGSNLCRYLSDNGVQVFAVVREDGNADRLLNMPENVSVIRCSLEHINSLKSLIAERDIDVFYHLAWSGSAGAARCDEALQLGNALYTASALRTADRMCCRKFVNAGSIMEREVLAAVYAQDSKPGAAYVYGAGKVAAHAICKPIANTLAIELCWAVITNAYGPGEISPRFVNTTIRRIINGEPLAFTSGVQNYDFVYIDDVVRAFALIGDHGVKNREYVIGSGNAKPLKSLILEIRDALAPQAECAFGDVPFTGVSLPLDAYCIDALREDCGFTPEVSLTEGVKHTMAWLTAGNGGR